MSSPTLSLAAPQIVLVAPGKTPAAQANARGHLFERLMARVFEAYGCEKPTQSSVNVRSDGYELDIETRVVLTHEEAIAECKAYTSRLPSQALSTFYGKLSAERLARPNLHGWFVAIPGLTSDGDQLVKKLAGDTRFRFIDAESIYQLITGRGWITAIQGPNVSDEGVLIAEEGTFAIAKKLDASSGLAEAVIVSGSGAVPPSVLALVAETDFAGGLPVRDRNTAVAQPSIVAPSTPTLVSVSGSSADFEYQLPASPRFFVGRNDILNRIRDRLGGSPNPLRVIVLNAQSGWGKSSLALRLGKLAEENRGYSAVFDTRTAASPEYVWAALRQALLGAASAGLLKLPDPPVFGSLASTLQTLQQAQWVRPNAPLFVFFDQFENVFRDVRLTQEFRDLTLSVRDIQAPFIVGFAWKTDLVGWTEKYPYQMRDEIRAAAEVVIVEPFGPTEVSTLLSRLAKESKTRLSADLRQRLREYSQGLPWLLKKLASHILVQLKAGTSESTLLQESLNVQRLFEQDLAGLQPNEIEALKLIAREAPVPVADIVERVASPVVQSLVDQRLLVRVGERLDVYWDIFREFLITGKVAVEETYILRLNPLATSNVLRELVRAGGEENATSVATELGTSLNVVFNAARELRQVGILAPRSGTLVLVEELRKAHVSEASLQARVSQALRKHRVYNLGQDLLRSSVSGLVTIDELASALPAVFPAVEAKSSTWKTYATAFANWLDYGGLFELRGQSLRAVANRHVTRTRLLGGASGRRQKTFPQIRPQAALSVLHATLGGVEKPVVQSTHEKAVSDWVVLGILNEQGEVIDQPNAERLLDDTHRPHVLRDLLTLAPGGAEALAALAETPNASPLLIGELIRAAYGQPWKATTISKAGSTFRAWANLAGFPVAPVTRQSRVPFQRGDKTEL